MTSLPWAGQGWNKMGVACGDANFREKGYENDGRTQDLKSIISIQADHQETTDYFSEEWARYHSCLQLIKESFLKEEILRKIPEEISVLIQPKGQKGDLWYIMEQE